MKWSIVIVAGSVITCVPSYGANCPYGQIYRVHLHECVSANSALARAYVGKPIYLPKHRILTHLPYIVPIPPTAPPADPANSDTVRMMKAGEIVTPKF